MPIASFIDSWIPQQIRNGANPTSASNYVRIELFHARVTVSILLSSIFVAAVCLLFGSSNVSWQISGVLVLGVVASLFQLYGLSTGRVTLVVCTRNVVFFLALTTAALILFGNGFWWIGHSIFFAIPPFSYVFVGREFASTMTYLCATLYVGLFAWSLSHDYDGESIVSTMTEIFRSGHLIFELTIVIVMWTLFVAYMQEKNGQTRLSSPFDELKEKSDSKARLISTMGHELRTPIHGMLAIAEMLSTTTPLSDDQRILLGSIQNCGRNLIQIVNHALKSTEAGENESRSPEAAEPFDIYVTMQRISEVVAIVVDRKKLDFCLDFSIPFKHNLVFGNGSALEQTFVNLLGNSIELTRSGTITLSASSGEVISSGSSSSGEFVTEKVPFRFVVCSTGDVSQVADPDENILSKNNTDNEGYVEVGLRVAKTVLSHMAGNLRVEFSRSEITHDGTLQFIIEISFRAVYDNSFPYDPIENTPIPHRYLPAEFRNLLGRVRNTRFAFYDPTQESQSDVHIRDLKVAKQWLDEFAAPTLMVANIEDLDETSVLVMESSVELEAQNPLNRVRGKNICIVCITRISKSVDVSLALRTELTENRIKIVAKPVTRVKFWMSVLELMKLSHEDSKRKSSDNEGSFRGQGGESPDEGSPQTRGEVFSFEGSVQDQDATQNDKEPIDVLIVEENEINKLILIKYLEGHEYTFHTTSNGGEVVEKFHKNSYRVVLMGIEIPVRDAINSVKELRKYENLARLGIDKPRKVDRAKIIIMMAEINHRRDHAMQAGCDDILQKPLSFNDLREKMPLWLPKSDRK